MINFDLDSKDGGKSVTVTITYQSNDKAMTSHDLILAMEMYIQELVRADEQQRQYEAYGLH